MLDILSVLFESLVSFIENILSMINFTISSIPTLFNILNLIPSFMAGPAIMALSIVIIVGIKKVVF